MQHLCHANRAHLRTADGTDREPAAMMDIQHMAQVLAQLAGAAILGGLQGLERERLQKPAGLRTHMLVALGAAVFVLATSEAGVSESDLSRVVQGVAAGVGFIGAGTILKLPATREIEGLTTAASLWLAAAVGLAVGAGLVWVPVVSSVLALGILLFAGRVSPPASRHSGSSDGSPS